MNDTAVLTNAPLGERPVIKPDGARRALPWAALLVLGCSAALVAVSFAGKTPLATIWPLVLAAIVVLGSLAVGLASRQRNWTHRLEAAEEECRAKIAESLAWQSQLADSHKTEEVLAKSLAEARAHLAELAGQRTLLQSELDSRKRLERTLSQQRQALESSKTVLEMHVEASTLELEKLQDRYELILNSAGEGICGLDPQGKATFVNPAVAKITGWTLAELIGKSEQEIFYQNGSNGHTESPDAGLGEQLFYRKDGTRFPVEFVRTKIEEHGRQNRHPAT